jgi:rhamnosyltransferase subunit B
MPGLNRERVKLGLPKITHYFPHLQSSADLYVTLFPEWYASTQPDYPKPLINGDFVRYSSSKDLLSDELTEFLNAGQLPILFTPGSGNLHGKSFFEMAMDVVRKLNARAIFLAKSREQLPNGLPDSVLWQTYVPFNKILPRVSMIVHHGGIGTLAEASKAGIPQLLIPSAYDQFDNALIIRDLGIGESIPMQFLTRRKLLSKLSEIQGSQSIKNNCMNVSSNFRPGLEAGHIMDKVLSTI